MKFNVLVIIIFTMVLSSCGKDEVNLPKEQLSDTSVSFNEAGTQEDTGEQYSVMEWGSFIDQYDFMQANNAEDVSVADGLWGWLKMVIVEFRDTGMKNCALQLIIFENGYSDFRINKDTGVDNDMCVMKHIDNLEIEYPRNFSIDGENVVLEGLRRLKFNQEGLTSNYDGYINSSTYINETLYDPKRYISLEDFDIDIFKIDEYSYFTEEFQNLGGGLQITTTMFFTSSIDWQHPQLN